MKYLILFEDTYGMADLFSSVYNSSYHDISRKGKLIDVNNEYSMVFGLSNKDCLRIKTKELGVIDTFKPEYVIIVMDLDKEQNDGSGILSYTTAKINLEKTEKRIKSVSPDSKVRYVPTVYASETVMLYQYMLTGKYNKDFCIEKIVHNKNTWMFHAVMVAILADLEKVYDSKKVRNYLDTRTISKSFQEVLNTYTTENEEIIRFMLDDNYMGIELEEFLNKINHIDKIFNKYKDIPIQFEICGVCVTSNDSLFSKKELFPNFPFSYK